MILRSPSAAYLVPNCIGRVLRTTERFHLSRTEGDSAFEAYSECFRGKTICLCGREGVGAGFSQDCLFLLFAFCLLVGVVVLFAIAHCWF
jgi:hypothetical protein